MTLLIASIAVDSLSDIETRVRRAWAGGADAVELRIDTFDGDPGEVAAFLQTHRDRTWIVTCRSAAEGGHFDGDTAERISRILAVARDSHAYVDFEWADWKRSANIRQKIGLAVESSERGESRLILSSHDFAQCPPHLGETIADMLAARPGTIAKVAYRAAHICDSFAALDAMHEHRDSVMGIAMGEEGLWTRVLAGKFGAFGTYCALDDDSSTAPGQCTMHEMVDQYNWSRINKETKVFGVIGDPVGHSMSPALFNRWFRESNINAVYLPFRVCGDADELKRFLDGCRSRPWLDIGGFSVTIPHKTAALRWVGSGADERTRRIGALNTLVLGENHIRGFNSDCRAAIDSLLDAMGCTRSEAKGLTIDVLGTGGVARAILVGLNDIDCDVTLYGRSAERTRELADEFGAKSAAWSRRNHRTGSVLINCTSVGMWPNVDATPMTAEQLDNCSLVFDLVYNPLETRLLVEAAKAGARTLGGLDMFVRQAAAQFEHWTGIHPDLDSARDSITRVITARIDRSP